MAIREEHQGIVQKAALAAGASGVPGALLPGADLPMVATIWTTMTVAIARASGHELNRALAVKLTSGVIKGGFLYIAGSKLLGWMLNLVPGVGTLGAVTSNAAFNYVYTINLGDYLSEQLSQSGLDAELMVKQIIGTPTWIGELNKTVFRKPSGSELENARKALTQHLRAKPHSNDEALRTASLLDLDEGVRRRIVVVERIESAESERLARNDILPVIKNHLTGVAFQPGHPRPRVLYVANPVDPNLYYPVAAFHQLTFDHKRQELLRLLSSLGARRILVEHEEGWSLGQVAHGDVSMPTPTPAGVSASVGISAEARSSSQARWEMHLPGSSIPVLPEQTQWLPSEPSWQTIVDLRLNKGLDRFEAELKYLDDFGVDANLTLGVEKIGLKLGGKFQEHRSTVWRMEGEFGPA